MAKDLPLGVRLNNPGNLEWGSPWEGLVPREKSRYFASGSKQQKRFCEFKDAASGIRAIARTLLTYADKRIAENGTPIDTVQEVIARWAPSHENNTSAYARHVADVVGVLPSTIINLKDYDTLRRLVVGIIAHENDGHAYPTAVIDEGLRRAGLVRKEAAKAVPVTVETVVGAGGAALVAAVGVADVLPEVIQAVSDHQAGLTSGDWKQVASSALLVAVSAVVAWAQARRRAAGAL